MAKTALDDEELWDEFHRVVNMSSRELAEWLRTRSASPDAETFPDQAGTPTGQEVLHVLGKRRTDLNADDLPVAGPTGWRHRLMSIGHDPLKPA